MKELGEIIRIESGSHKSFQDGNCAMELVAFMAKDSAKDVRKALEESNKPIKDWLKFTGANGREIHLGRAVLEQIAVVNEVIVQQEQPAPDKPKILVPELRPGPN